MHARKIRISGLREFTREPVLIIKAFEADPNSDIFSVLSRVGLHHMKCHFCRLKGS